MNKKHKSILSWLEYCLKLEEQIQQSDRPTEIADLQKKQQAATLLLQEQGFTFKLEK